MAAHACIQRGQPYRSGSETSRPTVVDGLTFSKIIAFSLFLVEGLFLVGIISNLVSIVSTGVAGIGGKIVSIAIGVVILIAVLGGCYLYLHDKNLALAKAEASLTLAQSELSSAATANAADLQTIDALRAQELQAQAAQVAMNTRDQAIQTSAATIQSSIDRDAIDCPALTPLPITGNTIAPIAVTKDGIVAPVLGDALAALGAAQANQGTTP